MSNALGTVVFKDGSKLYTQYQGSSNTFYPALFDTPEEVWTGKQAHDRHTESGYRALSRLVEMVEPEPVEVHSDYGSGHSFLGVACRKTKQLRVHYPEGWV